MSVRAATDEGDLYADPDEDLLRFIRPRDLDPEAESTTADEFRDPDGEDDPGTRPSRAEAIRHIEEASAEIDRITQQAWRPNQMRDETHDHRGLYYWLSGHPIQLMKREIRPLDPEKGDKLEVYSGNKWDDWLQKDNLVQGRDGDFWIDGPNGLLWVYERAILRPHPKFRITYRYGYDHVPGDIRRATAQMAAADIIEGDFYGTVVPGSNNAEGTSPRETAENWRERAEKVARRYRKVSFI